MFLAVLWLLVTCSQAYHRRMLKRRFDNTDIYFRPLFGLLSHAQTGSAIMCRTALGPYRHCQFKRCSKCSWACRLKLSLLVKPYEKNFNLPYWLNESRDSAVGIANGYGLDDRGVRVRVPVGSRIFSISSRPALGSTQPPIQRVLGALSLRVKRQGREADHSPPTSAEVKKM
jgi:hypothetical protein